MSDNSPYKSKDPQSVLDYYIDWSDWMTAGDSISTSSWDVSPDTLTEGAAIDSGNLRGVWLSGGTVGVRYRVTNTIVTAQGRTEQQSLWIVVRDK